MNEEILSEEDRAHFVERGYVMVREAFAREAAQEWTAWAFARLGYDVSDPTTWEQARVHLPPQRWVDVERFAPRAFAATCEVVGGKERIATPYLWADTFVANLYEGADEPYRTASAESPGWHKDGYFFRHFLDSPEQGLLSIVAWTDVLPRGGGTFVSPDSVGVVARFLAAHPEGVDPGVFGSLISQCREFHEITAQAGDVVLLHPFMLHAVSQNVLRAARIISNPPLLLREPLRLRREDGAYSLVEQAILRALNVEAYDFRPTAPREGTMPEWWLAAQRELASECSTPVQCEAGIC